MSGILPRARSGIVTASTLIEQTGGMRMRLGRTARLAAAASGRRPPGRGGGLHQFIGRRGASDRLGAAVWTLTSAPRTDAGHPGADWPTYGHDFARTGVAAGVAPVGGQAR